MKGGKMADNTEQLARIIAERSTPDPKRPRLAPDVEERLEPLDRRSAACYADAERLTHKLRRAREAIERENGESDGVPNEDLDEADSLVASASNLKLAAT